MLNYYPYLSDKEFLKRVDAVPNKEVFLRLIALDINNNPIATIEGKATGGSINVNGSSTVRRSGSVSLVADASNYKVEDIDNIIAINKRVKVEVGVDNPFPDYPAYRTLWFPQGEMLIGQPQITHNLTTWSISLNLKDQMALLNGEIGGTLPAAVTFSPMYDYSSLDEEGFPATVKPHIINIIYTLVNELGGIPKDRIVIRGIDDRIRNMCRWTNSKPVYLVHDETDGRNYTKLILNPSKDQLNSEIFIPVAKGSLPNPTKEKPNWIMQFTYGQNIGYSNVNFVYPGTLTSNAGDAITAVLDKIKNALGNFEYFFDLDGRFVFQPIQNYLNEGNEEENLQTLLNTNYSFDRTSGKTTYDFKDTGLIISASNTPQYGKIKNDFNIWGKKDNQAIRYHLAIDELPKIDNEKIFYVRKKGNQFVKANEGEENAYAIKAKDLLDWRTYVYLDYICNNSDNYYGKELQANWPNVINLETLSAWSEKTEENRAKDSYFLDYSESYPYWLDIIDSTNPAINQFRVSKIGRRVANIKNDDVNCMITYYPPDYVYIPVGQDNTAELRRECETKGQPYIQVANSIYNRISNQTSNYSALECVRSNLHEYISYNNSINLTCIPIYYLEPNTRISVADEIASIEGDYMIKTLTVPLTANGTMSITATKAIERL